jgi:hypothetical protein
VKCPSSLSLLSLLTCGCLICNQHIRSQLTGASSQGALTSMYAATTYRFSAIIVSSYASSDSMDSRMWIGISLVFIGTIISFASEGVPADKPKSIVQTTPPPSLPQPSKKSNQSKSNHLKKKDEYRDNDNQGKENKIIVNHHVIQSDVTQTKKNISQPQVRKRGVSFEQGELVLKGSHSPDKNKIRRRASAPRLSELEMAEFEYEFERVVREESMSSMSPNSISRLRKSSSLHSDLDLMQSMRYSV